MSEARRNDNLQTYLERFGIDPKQVIEEGVTPDGYQEPHSAEYAIWRLWPEGFSWEDFRGAGRADGRWDLFPITSEDLIRLAKELAPDA